MTPEQQLEKDEAAREWRRAYYIANKDKIKAQTKVWKAENPDRKRELNRDYKARQTGKPIDPAKVKAPKVVPEKKTEQQLEDARVWQQGYYLRNQDKVKARTKAWKAANPERKNELNRAYKARNPEKIAAYNEANKVEIAIKQAAKYQKNKAVAKVYGAKRYQEKKAEIDAKNAAYAAANYDSIRASQREYKKNKLKTDPSFRLVELSRRRMHHALKGVAVKSAKTIELLGCNGEFLRTYLEQFFTDGMTWENQGKWQIDHHIPVSFFDLTKAEHQKRCFHYSNLRPLWASENRKKWDDIPLKALLTGI